MANSKVMNAYFIRIDYSGAGCGTQCSRARPFRCKIKEVRTSWNPRPAAGRPGQLGIQCKIQVDIAAMSSKDLAVI
jgi:hypothetical protein